MSSAIDMYLREGSRDLIDQALGKGYSIEDVETALQEHYGMSPVNADVKPGEVSDINAAKQYSNALAKGSASAPKETTNNVLAGVVEPVASAVLGSVTGGSPGTRGITNALAGMLGDTAAGKEVDPSEVAMDALKGTATSWATNLAGDLIGAGAPMVGSMVGMGIDAMQGKNVDVGSGLAGTTGAIVGGLALSPLGPWGSMLGAKIGGSFGQWGARDGFIGDGFDSRTHEPVRDAVEDAGASYGDSKKAAAHYSGNQKAIEAAINGDPRDGDESAGVSPAADYDHDINDDEAYA